MDYFFLIISNKNDICKDQTNFDLALQRYYKYVKKDGSLKFQSFGWQEAKENEVLFNLYEYVMGEGIEDFTVVRICFNKDISDEKLYIKNDIDSKYIMDLFNNNSIKNLYKKENVGKNKIWQLADLIENIYFQNIVKSFMHGQKNDLVNSHLGLLKIWCDNSNENEKVHLSPTFLKEKVKISKAKKLLKKLKTALSITFSVPEFLQIKITKSQYFIGSILKITKDDIMNNSEMKKSLSNNISQLFQFVSDYHEQIKG